MEKQLSFNYRNVLVLDAFGNKCLYVVPGI